MDRRIPGWWCAARKSTGCRRRRSSCAGSTWRVARCGSIGIRSTSGTDVALHIEMVSLFPEMIRAAGSAGVTGRALTRGLVTLGVRNPRDYATDAHRTVDDRPYGGGPGMVMKIEPLRSAIRAARTASPEGSRTVYLSA